MRAGVAEPVPLPAPPSPTWAPEVCTPSDVVGRWVLLSGFRVSRGPGREAEAAAG